MQAVIRNADTGLFLKGRSYHEVSWVPLEKARVYPSVGNAKNSASHLLQYWSSADRRYVVRENLEYINVSLVLQEVL